MSMTGLQQIDLVSADGPNGLSGGFLGRFDAVQRQGGAKEVSMHAVTEGCQYLVMVYRLQQPHVSHGPAKDVLQHPVCQRVQLPRLPSALFEPPKRHMLPLDNLNLAVSIAVVSIKNNMKVLVSHTSICIKT